MFFLTEQDPNYRIKGSRDPLGFQPIWQSLGREVIKYLSTVSINLKDFQVLSYAWYFYGDRNPREFLKFFIKFEQAFGFARGLYLPNDGFNGVDYVKKNLNNEFFSFSKQNKHTLLSNQKSYGIYGKYNRPFTDMKIKEKENFREVMENALLKKVNFSKLQGFVDKLLNEDLITLNKNDLYVFAECLNTITTEEKEFFKSSILRVEDDHVQNEIFDIFSKNPTLLETERFNLFQLVDTLLSLDISTKLRDRLIKIKNAEQILTPYSFLFRTIQTEPVWNKGKIETISIFDSFPNKIDYQFNHNVLDTLNEYYDADPYQKVLSVINRNKAISENRKNSAWIKEEANSIVVSYSDGGRFISEFDYHNEFENNYFLPTYISLYKQILLNNE